MTNDLVPVASPMTEPEARQCVQRINAALATIRYDVLDLYEREGWHSLGYATWRECCALEFGFSDRQAYRLADAGRVDRLLTDRSKVVAVLPETHVRELAPLLKKEPEAIPAIWRELHDEHGEHLTAAKIREAVIARVGPKKAKRKGKKGVVESEATGNQDAVAARILAEIAALDPNTLSDQEAFGANLWRAAIRFKKPLMEMSFGTTKTASRRHSTRKEVMA